MRAFRECERKHDSWMNLNQLVKGTMDPQPGVHQKPFVRDGFSVVQACQWRSGRRLVLVGVFYHKWNNDYVHKKMGCCIWPNYLGFETHYAAILAETRALSRWIELWWNPGFNVTTGQKTHVYYMVASGMKNKWNQLQNDV